ncbi:MAG: hypothetical protein KDH96_05645, partial [Candidatus Riesia sp.]|nr:hypothetical protein [Candidatus Riesia sp.]
MSETEEVKKAKNKKQSLEKDFMAEIQRTVDYQGITHFERIPDLPWLQKRAGFQFKKPYDCYWLRSGKFHAIELKAVRGGLSWSFRKLEDHQEIRLKEVVKEGGEGWIWINFRGELSAAAKKKYGVEVLNRSFAVTIDQLLDCRVLKGMEKFTVDWCIDHAVELPMICLD